MVLESFTVYFKGKKEIIEFETELSFGDTELIINKSVDLSDVNKPKINIANYRRLLLLKTIKKAPFGFANEQQINAVPNKVMNEVLEKISKEYPLVNFLGDWMTSFMGSVEENDLPSEPTPSVQPSSDGPKEKQTTTEPSSSSD